MKTKLILPLLAAVLTLLVANPVRATILPPVMIGTNGVAALGTNLTITVTDVNGVSAGNVIIVTFTMTNKSGTVSCADSGGNSYSVDANFVNTNSAIRTVVLSASVTNALQQSDLITLTFPSVIPKAACAFYVNGLLAASRLDKTNSASGNSTNLNSGTITTTQTNELLIGAIGMQSSTVPTLTPGTNYTALLPAYSSALAPASHILTEYQIVTNTGSYAASGTTALSRLWLAGIVTYKGGSNQTINFPALGNPTYGDAPISLNATASSGLPVTYAVLSGPATIVSSNQLTITGAGTVTIQAAQFGNATYSGTATNQTITVSPLPVQLTGTRAYDGTTEAAATDLIISNNLDSGNLTLTGSGTLSGKNVGTQSITNLGTPLRVSTSKGAVGSTPTNSFTVTIPPPQNGNTLIAVISTRLTSRIGVTNISQTGATWTRTTNSVSTSVTETEIWYATNLTSAATNLIIQTTNAVFASAVVMEYQGLLAAAPLDGAATLTNRSSTALTGTNVTTQANELWIGGIGLTNSTLTLSAITNSFTLVTSNTSSSGTASSNAVVYALEKIVTATNAAYSSGTVSAPAHWSGAIATFKAVALGLSGSAATNYTLAGLTGSLTITGKVLTVTGLTATNRLYDGTTNVTLGGTAALLPAETIGTGTTSDGKFYVGDLVTLVGSASGSFADKHVGIGKIVAVTGNTLSGGDAGNYTLQPPAGLTANISATNLTVTATTNTKVYDRTTSATNTPVVTAGSIQGGDMANFTETYSSATVGVANRTLVPSGTVNDGNGGANYNVAFVNFTTGTITAQALAINGITANNKLYNGTTTTTITTNGYSFSGVLSPDVVVLATNGYTATFTNKNVGSGQPVTVTGLSLTGAQSGNYTLTNATFSTLADIIPTNITVTAVTNTKIYDRTTNAAATPIISPAGGIQPGDTANFTEAYADATAGVTNKILIPAGVVSDGNSGANYSVTLVNFNTGSITAKVLTVTGITATDKVYDRTNTATLITTGAVLGAGVISPDTVALVTNGAVGTFASSNVANNITVTITGLTLTGPDASNYAITAPTTTANITQRVVSVASGLTATSRLYNGTTTATITSNSVVMNGLVAPDTLTIRTNGYTAIFADRNVGSNKTVTVTGLTLLGSAVTNNYSLTQPTNLTANITATNITVTAVTNTKVYDRTTGAVATPNVTAGSIQAGDTASFTEVYTNAAAGTGNKVLVPIGAVTDGNSGANYNVTLVNFTTGSITAKALTVTGITAADKVYDRTNTATIDAILAATNGVISPDVVQLNTGSAVGTFASSNVANNITVTITGLTLTGADAGNYSVTTPTTTANITQRVVSVAAGLTANNRLYNGTTVATVSSNSVTLANVVAGDTLAVRTNGYTAIFADRNVGSNKVVTVTGLSLLGTAVTNNYLLTQPTLSANIAATNLGVTARTNTKVYDQTVSATNTPTVGSIQPGDTANFAEAYATATAGTGNKILVPSGSVNDGNGGANYNVMFTNFTAGTISPKPLTMSGITVSNKVYDATTTAAINTSGAQLGAGVINPDVVALVTNGAAGAFLTAGVGVAKPVTITGNTLSGADAGNYSLTQQTGLTADITPALVTTLAGTRGYNGTVEAAAADLTIVNNQDGINLTLTGSGTLSGENVGPQSIANTGIPVRVNVSTGSVGGTPTNSFTVMIPPPQNGNTLIAVISARLTSRTGVTNISQAGATWTRAAQSVSTNITETEIWYATNLTSAATSLTVKLTNAVFASAVVMEYQGLLAASPLDGAATLTNRSATALTGTNVTTQANELWIGGIGLTNSALTLSAITNSFTLITNSASISGTASSNALVYALEKIVTATNAAYSGGTVSAPAYWSGAIATFKAAQPWVPLALAGSAATNYSLVGVSGTMIITGKVLTVTGLTAGNKVYDATTNATVSGTPALLSAEAIGTGTTLDGKSYSGDVVALTGATVGSFTNKNVGTNKPVLVAGLALIGADATNYSLPQPVLSANITPKPLSVTGITAADKPYDRTFAATIDMSFAALGPEWIFPDDVTLQLYGSGTFASSNVASGIVVTITNLLITGADAGNYVITPTTTTASITKRDVSVTSGLTANNRLYNGTATATISSNNVRFLNMIAGDTNSVKLRTNGYTATFADKNFGSGKTVTVTGLSLQGTAATNNYKLLQPTILPATISRTNLTVTARTNTKVYDQTTSATNTPTITFGSIQFGDTVTNFTEAYADPTAGITNKILIPAVVVNDGFGGSNYIVTLVNFNTGTITARTLTITNITAFPKVYDATTNAIIDALGAQIVELAAIFPDDVALDSSGAAGAFATAGVGVAKPVTITGNVLVGADVGNYSLIQQTGLTADITPRPVALTGTRIYNATTVAAAADLTITNNLDGANLTLSGNGTLTAKDVGLRSITNGVAPVRVNVATGAVGGTATNSFNVTIPTPQNGNTLIAVISTRLTSANGVTNIIQNGALWTRSAKSVGTSVTATEIWYATNLTSAATNLTIKMTNAVFASAVVLEYQGLLTAAPLDGATTLTNRSVAALTGTNTPTQANELWIGGIGLTNSTFTLAAIQNSFVAVANVASGSATASSNAVVYALEKIVTATNAAYSGGTVSGGNVNWSGAIATFKAPQPWAPLALTGSAGSNYTLSGMSAVLKITHKALAVNGLIASNKWYDATTVASLGGTPTLLAAEPPGTGTTVDKTPYAGDAISLNASNAVGSFASANIGTNIPVAVSGCILTGADTNNYTLNQPTNLAANITVGPASQLVFNQQPADTYSGWPMSTVTVQILDQYGNLTAGTTNIVLSIGNNPGGGALSGLRTNAAVNGTATFTNLSINNPGTNYTLLASATGLTAATSDTFNILPPSPDLPGALTNLVTISAGSLVVPMDNTNQAIGVPFNLKSYGLINQFLQNGIRVRWAIRTGKAKDAADFTAAAFRLKPTPSGVTNSVSFAGGPFIIDQTNAAAALGIITNWGKTSAGTNNNVAVFQLVSNTLVDIRHEIHFRPYVVVNTTLSPIDTDLLDYVGITNYTVTPDYTLSPDDCYSILMEPHQSSTNGVAAIKAFVEAGGNFLAQCASVDAYENAAAGNFQNSGSLTIANASTTSAAASMAFPNPDLPFSQCVGIIKTNIVGLVTEWTEGGVALNHAHTHASTSATNIMRATCSKHTIGLGGMVFYFGGHSYFKNITTGGDGAGDPVMTNDLAFINGVRMTLNTIFIPCGRRACDFVPTADLGITKTASNSVVVGQSLTYTITVTNQGPNGATNLVVTDTLPAGVSVLNTGGGTNIGTNIIWTLSSLTNHAVAIYTLVVQAPISGYAFLTNTARVISDIDDPIYTNNATPAVITAVIPSADLAIGKTAPGFVSATNNFDYTISVTNLGPSAASSVTVTDVFPADVSFVSASGNATLSDSGDSVTWNFGTLTNGQISTVTLTVTAPANGTLTNTASVGSLTTGDPNLTNNVTSGVISSVQTISDLAIGKTAPSTVYAASNLVYRISVTNFGPSSASSVTVTDILPVSATFVSALGNWTTNGNVVTWDLGTLSSGQVSNLTVKIMAPASGILTNVANVSAPTTDPNSTNNISLPVITSVIPLADVWVFKSSVSPSLVNLGDPVTYTIIASNAGPSTAFGVIVNDILPAGVALQSAPGSISTSGGVVTWPTVTLAAGDWTNYSLTLTAPALYAFTNIAVVTNATTIDPHPTNNNGSSFISRAITQVVPVADLSVVLTGPTNVIETSNFVCSITISNAGPFPSLDIAVADSLLTPLDYYYITASPLGTITFNPDFITWPSLPSLSAGSAVTYTFTLNALDTGWFTNIASAFSATTFDPNLTNNSGELSAAQLQTLVVVQFTTQVVTPTFNPQTGLYEERIWVTNNSIIDAAALRIFATDLRPGVYLQNAYGVIAGQPYVLYNFPLPAGSSESFLLEFLSVDYDTFTNGIRVEMLSTNYPPPAHDLWPAAPNRIFPQDPYPGLEPHLVNEFTTIPGRNYMILYGDTPVSVTNVSIPTIRANSSKTLWIDSGPPKTASDPATTPVRFYRILLQP